MDETRQPFCETTDLYLQLLGDAQRMEDQRMVRMILRKLRNCGRSAENDHPDSGIIPFPGARRRPVAAGRPDLFWQDIFFWQNLVQFLILLIAGATWLTLPFILSAMLH